MRFSPYPRLFNQLLLALLTLAFAGLSTGCQSTRPSFSFQPASRRLPALAAPTAPTTATANTLPAPAIPLVAAASQPAPMHYPSRQRARPVPRPLPKEAILAPTPVASRFLARRRPLLSRPHAQAEAGLGTTVLGILGLVVLPIALIGLALSGGGVVWAIVAGAAALAVLVAYLDPFGRR